MLSGVQFNGQKYNIFTNNTANTSLYTGCKENRTDSVYFTANNKSDNEGNSRFSLKKFALRAMFVLPLLLSSCGSALRPASKAEIENDFGPAAMQQLKEHQAAKDKLIKDEKLYDYKVVTIPASTERVINPDNYEKRALKICQEPASRRVMVYMDPSTGFYHGNIPENSVVARVDGMRMGKAGDEDSYFASVTCYGGEPVPESRMPNTHKPGSGIAGKIVPSVENK